ncbi:MAG: phage portal protein [Dehalococcoidia bacterium]|nr:phage portal protein [Dehalococcoidia bacterium]
MTEINVDTDLQRLLRTMDLDRLRAYRENLDFYNGLQWPAGPRQRGRRLTFNYARVLVDKVSSYLMSSLNFAVDPVEGVDAENARRAEEYLYQVYQDNNLEQLDLETEIDTAILGDGCFKVIWDPVEARVRVTSPDVQGLFAWWVGDDRDRVWRVASRYRLDAAEVANRYGGRPVGGSSEVVEVWTGQGFQIWLDGLLVRQEANPYGFIPFVIFPNLRDPKGFWGVSDIPVLRPAAVELNRAMTALSTILELSGNPIAVLENVDKAEDIAVQPGAVWELPQDARAYLLDLLSGGGVRLHIDYIEQVRRTLHDLSESPRAAFGDTERQLSGVALEMEMHPLLQKVKRKRLIRTVAYKRRNEMALRILERFTGEGFAPFRSRIVWGPVLPQDRSRLVSDERALVDARLHSRRRAMDSLGVQDPEKEISSILEEARLLGADTGSAPTTQGQRVAADGPVRQEEAGL